MKSTRITYDAEGDILYITFGQPTAATGYQLSDQLLLRVDPRTQQATGLTIFNFSVHARTAKGIPLREIEEDLQTRPFLLQILGSPPVTHFLRIVEHKQGVSAVVLRPFCKKQWRRSRVA
jgi:uncharacterized protein YuzE